MGTCAQSRVRRQRPQGQAVRSPGGDAVHALRIRRSRRRIVGGIGLLLGGVLALWGARLWLSSRAEVESSTPVVLPSVPGEARAGIRALADAVVGAVHRRDRAALEGLLLTKEEFCTKLWVALPPTPNLSCAWVWEAYAPQNAEGMNRILREHGGRAYTLLRVEPQRIVVYKGDVRVYERVRLVVMDESGTERVVRLFGSICEVDRIFRLCSFILD